MAPRAVGTASIAFGLVNIPVKLYSAANPSAAISFRLLSKSGHRLKQQYVDPADENHVVARDEMVKGYEFAKDQYVIFEEGELKELAEKPTQSIEITEFLPEENVPRVYFHKTYYLGPDRGGDRAYKLLARALTESGRCGLAKYAARGKQYLVLVTPRDEGLEMHQLNYPDEITPFAEVPLGDAEVKDAELRLALQLIDAAATNEFHPEKYEDEVKKRVEEAVQRKIEGQAFTVAPEEAPKGQIIDLMEALKASLGAGAGGEASEGQGDSGEKKAGAKKAKKA